MPREVVELDDLLAVRGVGELQAEQLGVVFGLLETVRGRLVISLGLNNGDGEIRAVSEEIVDSFTGTAHAFAANHNDSAVRERDLLTHLVRLVVPSRCLELGDDEPTAGVGLVSHLDPKIGFPGRYTHTVRPPGR